jgi:hypothetical protein
MKPIEDERGYRPLLVNSKNNDRKRNEFMCFLISFAPATFWAIIGYFVLFSSTRAEARIRTLGQVLAVWTFVIAALIPIAAAYITVAGLCPIEAMLNAVQ